MRLRGVLAEIAPMSVNRSTMCRQSPGAAPRALSMPARCEHFVKTRAPQHILPKTNASPLLAQLVTSKYVYSLPLYRQEAMF